MSEKRDHQPTNRIEDLAKIVTQWLGYFFAPGDVTELRAVQVSRPSLRRPHIEGGFYDYDHLGKMALDALTITRHATGVYFVMNPLRKDILSRRANRIEPVTDNFLSKDVDVINRKWLLIDCDPIRDPFISATAEEKEAARELADEVMDHLRKTCWPDPILADSGNGYHLFYKLPQWPNTNDVTKKIKSILNWLGERFDNKKCIVDRSVFNASRIVKLPGTLSKKGDDMPDRPHRRSRLLYVPGVTLPSIEI